MEQNDLNNLDLGGVEGFKAPKPVSVQTPNFAGLPEPEYGAATMPAFPKAETLSNKSLNTLDESSSDDVPTIAPAEPAPKVTADSLYDNWAKSQSQQDLSTLVDYFKPQIAKSISALVGESSPAIETKAKLLAIKAIKTFDPASGAALTTWIYTQLQPLRRYNQQSEPVPVSERVKRRLAELRNFEDQFEDNHGRPPSDSEVSDALGWSKKALEQLRRSDRKATSYEAPMPSEDGETTTQGDLVALEEDKTTEIIELFYESLSPVEQTIIEHRLGLWGKPKLSNSELAKKLKMSPARVSQIAGRLADELERFKSEYGDIV